MKLLSSELNMNHKGFTLMEVMVSVSIFAIIITIGIGSLLTIYSTLQKTRADQQVMDSLSYVMDTMTRRVRTGTEWSSPDGQTIRFRDQIEETTGGNMITYGVRPSSTTGEMRLYVEEADGEYDITPENMTIDAFTVNLTGGTNGSDGGQPLVEFQIQATIKNGKQETPLAIQTAVSQRPFESASSSPLVKSPDSGSFGGTQAFNPDSLTEQPQQGEYGSGPSSLDITNSTMEYVASPTTGTVKASNVRGQ